MMHSTGSGGGERGTFQQLDDEQQMPMSFTDTDAADNLTIATGSSRRRIGFGAMLFLVFLAIAGVSLWVMRSMGSSSGVAAPSEANKVVESFLSERAKAPSTKLPADLLNTDGYTALQVKRDELRKNPFVLAGVPAPEPEPARQTGIAVITPTTPEVPSAPVAPRDDRGQRAAQWSSEVEKAAATLKVGSTLIGATPAGSMVSVNGRVLRVGDRLDSTKPPMAFVVAEITTEGAGFTARSEALGAERTVFVKVNQKE
ncbi:MAG: hypothetical protein LW636_12715 [Planctomycetaceae bacterium]|nr:hypothetical protein [Planctomycetaceae bacterium]